MKIRLPLFLLLAASLFLGACKHRKKSCCPCSGEAMVAAPVPNSFGYQGK